MVSDVNEENTNNGNPFHIITILFLFFLLLGVFFIGNYIQHRKANGAADTAAKIKNILTKQTKTAPMPWKQLLGKSKALSPASVAEAHEIPEYNLADQSMEDLANFLNSKMQQIDSQDLPSIQKNLEAAEIIISRVPDSYSAYKAKLISLLVKEAKFNQDIEDYEIDSLLTSMATFDVSSNTNAIREAILIAGANNEIYQLEAQLADIILEKEEIELQQASTDLNSDEIHLFEGMTTNLLGKEQELFEKIVALERNMSDSESLSPDVHNEDIVHIPFLRLLARNDYAEVINNATTFIEQFPYSPIGHLYLIHTLRLLGRDDEALIVILNSQLNKESLFQIQEHLDDFTDLDPKNYWKLLKF